MSTTCQQCGTHLAQGLCPRCLLAEALEDQPRRGIHPLWFAAGAVGVLGSALTCVVLAGVVALETTTVDVDITRGEAVATEKLERQVKKQRTERSEQRKRAMVALAAARADAARSKKVVKVAREVQQARVAAPARRKQAARERVANDPMDWLDSEDLRGAPAIDPPVCYALAELGTSSDQVRALRCAETALNSRGRWSGQEWLDNVDSLYRLRAEVSHDIWERSGESADRARARTYSSDWLDFALVARQDITRPRELCDRAWKDPARCGG